MFITLPATSSGRSTGCRTRKPTPSRTSAVAERFWVAACLYDPGIRVAMRSSASTPSPAGTPNTQPAPSASRAPATGPPTNADITCCAASVRPFAASRRERGTRSGTSAEPARSTNTSVTP